MYECGIQVHNPQFVKLKNAAGGCTLGTKHWRSILAFLLPGCSKRDCKASGTTNLYQTGLIIISPFSSKIWSSLVVYVNSLSRKTYSIYTHNWMRKIFGSTSWEVSRHGYDCAEPVYWLQFETEEIFLSQRLYLLL